MDAPRFDSLARSLAEGGSRRGFVGGPLGLGAGLLGVRTTAAATCPPGRVSRPRVGCVCRATGRAPVGGVCPCPRGQADTGDGRGCLACRADGDCPGFGEPCLDVTCDPTDGCVARPVGDGEPGGCPGGYVCHQGTCQLCGLSDEPCCRGETCVLASLVCHEGTCRDCGKSGQPCCAGGTCTEDLACHEGTCQLCGNSGQPCCAGGTCSVGTCSGGLCLL